MLDLNSISYLNLTYSSPDSDVRHPRCVLYNSKELGVLHLVEHNYICLYYYKEDIIIITTCFGPICGSSSGCD